MPFNAMDLFQAGNQLGQASAGPATYGVNSLMDMFGRMQQLGMYGVMQRGLQENEQQVLNKYEPERKGLELQKEYEVQQKMIGGMLDRLGLHGGAGGGDASTSTDASTPKQSGSPTWKSFKFGPLEIGNPNFEAAQKQATIPGQVQQTQLDESTKAVQAAQNVLPVLDRLHDLYKQAIPNPVSVTTGANDPFGVQARIAKEKQALTLKAQGSANPALTTYHKELESFSNLIGRGAFGEVGRIPFLQNMQNIKNFPDESNSREEAENLWKGNYNVVGSHINTHNKLVSQYLGPNSPDMVTPNSKYIGQYMGQDSTSTSDSSDMTDPKSRLEAKLKQRGWL